MKRALVVAFSLLPVALMVSGVATGAAAAVEPEQRFNGAQVVRYAEADPTALHEELKGTRNAKGGCDFSLNGNSAGRYDEIAFDPSDCRSLLEITPAEVGATKGQVGSDGQAGTEGAGQGNAGGVDQAGGGVAPAAFCPNPYRDNSGSYAQNACIHSWFEDPPALHVNDLTNEVQWNPRNGCANGGSSYVSYYYQLLTATGWTVANNAWLPEFNCGGVVSHNETVFQNTAFCGGILPVLTGYNQRITGLANGGYSWNVNWAKNGVCHGLLSFHTENGR